MKDFSYNGPVEILRSLISIAIRIIKDVFSDVFV